MKKIEIDFTQNNLSIRVRSVRLEFLLPPKPNFFSFRSISLIFSDYLILNVDPCDNCYGRTITYLEAMSPKQKKNFEVRTFQTRFRQEDPIVGAKSDFLSCCCLVSPEKISEWTRHHPLEDMVTVRP